MLIMEVINVPRTSKYIQVYLDTPKPQPHQRIQQQRERASLQPKGDPRGPRFLHTNRVQRFRRLWQGKPSISSHVGRQDSDKAVFEVVCGNAHQSTSNVHSRISFKLPPSFVYVLNA